MGKKSNVPKVSLAESFIQFQIQVKGNEIEEFRKEIKELEFKNRKLIELQDELRVEQLKRIHVLHKQVNEHEKELEQLEIFSKLQLEQALEQNLELAQTQETDLEEWHERLASVQAQVMAGQVQKEEYMRTSEQQLLIQNLQAELVEIQKEFEEMPEAMKHALETALREIDRQTSKLIAEKKQLAVETVLNQMDVLTCHEFRENSWLKTEVAVYRDDVSLLEINVRSLERENLKSLRQLFKYRLSHLQISRSRLLMQVAEEEQMEYEQERENRAVSDRKPLSPHKFATKARDERDPSFRFSSPLRNLRTFLYGSQMELSEPQHLDSLEQPLTVVGGAITLNQMPSGTDDSSTSSHPELLQAKVHPLTTPIIHKKFQ